MKKITRAISIKQPYVEQILRGLKKVEYRKVRTKLDGERVYLYASRKPVGDIREWQKVGAAKGELETEKILGSVEIRGCLPKKHKGNYQYVLCNPKRLARPKIAKNHPNPVFWKPKF